MQARVERFREERILVIEEMRRILVYCDWKANWWRVQSSRRGDATPEVAAGLRAYAEKQAVLWESLATSFASMWYTILVRNGHEVDWPARYRIVGEKEYKNPTQTKRTTLALARLTRPPKELPDNVPGVTDAGQSSVDNIDHIFHLQAVIKDGGEFITIDLGEDDDADVSSADESDY